MSEVKFEIKKDNIEIKYKDRDQIKPGCTLDNMNSDPEILGTYETKEEAIEALRKYKTEISEFSCSVGRMFDVTEYYVEENVYDDNGEPESCNGVWEESKMEIFLKNEDREIIDTFDNYADAEAAYNECDDECSIEFD